MITTEQFIDTGYKTYLGDGVYYKHDGYCTWLATYDGYKITNEICLEPEVLEALERQKEHGTLES